VNLKDALKKKNIPFQVSGSHIYFSCIFCGKENKMYFNLKKLIGDCKVCGSTVTLKELYSHFNLRSIHKKPSLEELKTQMTSLNQPKENQPVTLEKISWPEESRPVQNFAACEAYLRSRGLGIEEVIPHQLRYAPHGFWAGRILVPAFSHDRKLVGIQGRVIIKSSKDIPYKFSKGFPRSQVLFGLANSQEDPVILTEGVFPAIQLGGMATYGKNLTNGQMEYLLNTINPSSKVCLLWDHDSWIGNKNQKPSSFKALEKLSKHFEVRAIMLPKGQPDDYSKNDIIKWVKKSFTKASKIYIPE